MGRLSKNLSGLNQKVIVGTATYTAQTTYNAFIANAADGEVGVFLDTGAVRTTALTSTVNKFFIAQKRDGVVNKTAILDFNDIFRKLRTAYDAPVKQVSTIGYNGTSGDIGFNFASASATNTLTYGITVRETTPGNQPFPVQEGYATVNSTTADEYTVLASIVSQLNGDFDYERVAPDSFVKAEILSNGAKTNLTNGATVTNLSRTVTSTAHAQAVGALLELRDVVYKVAAVPDANTITLDRPYQGASEVIAASANAASIAYTSGTTALGVRLTALLDESHFKVVGAGGLYLDTITAITAWKLGSGSGASVRELEATEGAIFDGVGSTINAPFKADYGQPSLISSTSGTYDLIFLDLKPQITPAAALPIYSQNQIQRILIAAPNGGTLNSTLQTVFGV